MSFKEYFPKSNLLFEREIVTRTGLPIGVPREQILKEEDRLGIVLCEAHRQLLEFMGHDFQGVLRGSELFLKDLHRIHDYVPELLEENSIQTQLSNSALCFYSHQGYQVCWYELPQADENPQCYYFSEGESGPLFDENIRFFPDIDGFLSYILEHVIPAYISVFERGNLEPIPKWS